MSEWWVHYVATNGSPEPIAPLCNFTQCLDNASAVAATADDSSIFGDSLSAGQARLTSGTVTSTADAAPSLPTSTLVSLSFTAWAGLLTILLLLFTALGNTLVCIAIAWDKRLQNMTNYFLLSLAVTDFMVALLVMPFGIMVIFKGSFTLSPAYCIVWITLDVLFCTCSILHLCTLSVDRYLSLRYPIKYGRNKTKRRVVLKICLVWMTSVAMSVPLCLMYSRNDQEVIKDGICAIQDPLYMTIGSIISFYIPLLIMLVTHALTLQLLKEAEKTKTITVISNDCGALQAGTAAASSGTTIGSSSTDSPYPFRQPSYNWKRLLSKTYSNVSSSTEADNSDTHSMFEMQRMTTPEETPRRRSGQRNRLQETQIAEDIPTPSPAHMQILSFPSKGEDDDRKNSTKDDEDTSSEEVWVEVAIDGRGRANSLTLHPTNKALDHTSSTNHGHSFHGARYALCCSASTAGDGDLPSFVPTAVNGNDSNHVVGSSLTQIRGTGWSETSPPRLSQGSDESPRLCELTIPMRSVNASRTTSIRRSTTRQGRFIQSERKATKVLGIIFFTFVILWAPFFSLNIVCGLCPSCAENISPTVSYLVLWLGYASSTVNPVFYTIFNPTFRQTFVKILTLQCLKASSPQASNPYTSLDLAHEDRVLAQASANTGSILVDT